MAVAYVQEFRIEAGDTSTTNYDAVVVELGLDNEPAEGLIVHTAGFDHDRGVFRIVDVWETRGGGSAVHGRAAHADHRAARRAGRRGRVQPADRRVLVRAARRRALDVPAAGRRVARSLERSGRVNGRPSRIGEVGTHGGPRTPLRRRSRRRSTARDGPDRATTKRRRPTGDRRPGSGESAHRARWDGRTPRDT